jgi:nitrogen PTS system EIIA component
MADMKTSMLRISGCLTAKQITFFPAGLSKDRILAGLVGTLGVPEPDVALKAVLDRELWGSTVVRRGLALPHARIPQMTSILAALGICPRGMLMPSGEVERRRQIFLLFVGPTHNMERHIAFLASVSTLFKTEGLWEGILHLTTPEAVLAKIHEAEALLS